MNSVEQLQQAIDSHKRVVFFGGAGVSTESGIPDYRGKDGTDKEGPDEEGYTPEERRYHDYFLSHPEKFHDEFIVRFNALSAVEPNATHYKLAELERAGKLRAVVTQNIDGLRHRGDSSIRAAVTEIANADMLIIAGTSLAVYPAAGLVDYFRGDCLVLMDRQKTPRDEMADILIREPIAQVFAQIKA